MLWKNIGLPKRLSTDRKVFPQLENRLHRRKIFCKFQKTFLAIAEGFIQPPYKFTRRLIAGIGGICCEGLDAVPPAVSRVRRGAGQGGPDLPSHGQDDL